MNRVNFSQIPYLTMVLDFWLKFRNHTSSSFQDFMGASFLPPLDATKLSEIADAINWLAD